MSPHPDHRGCNFFIQYKLSKLIEGHRGGEWDHWRKPYLRFQIPYSTKDTITKRYYDDYNQFDHLKDLANMEYLVYYFTNHVLYDKELFYLASKQRLLDEIPILDVSNINGHHKKVTFTKNSSYFLLHSELEEIEKRSWEKIFYNAKESKGTYLSKDVEILKEFIFTIEKKKKETHKQKGFYDELERFSNWPEEEKIIGEVAIILKYLRRNLDVYWFRL